MKFVVTAPDGRKITLSGESAPTEQDLNEIFNTDKDYTLGRLVTADKGATFGLGRKASGLIYATGSKLADASVRLGEIVANAQNKGLSGAFDEVEKRPSFWEHYHDMVDPQMQAAQEYAEDKPVEAAAVEIGSSLVNPVNKFGVGYIGKGGTLANKAARSSAVGGVVGGVAGGLNTEYTDDLGQNIAIGSGAGAALGGALPVAANKAGALYNTIRDVFSPQAAVAQLKSGIGNIVKNNQSMRILNRGIQSSDDIAAQVARDTPSQMGALNEEMSDILNSTTGRKIDINQALANRKQEYADFIKQNAETPVLNMQDDVQNVANNDVLINPNKKLTKEEAETLLNDKNALSKLGIYDAEQRKVLNFGNDNDIIGIGGKNGESIQNNGQLGTNAERARAIGTGTAGKAEKSAAVRDLVKFGQDRSGVARNGLFIPRDNETGVFTVNPEVETLFDKAGFSKSNFRQLKNNSDDAQVFHDAISQAKKDLGAVGEQVWVYSPEEYQNMKLFLSEDGLSGVAVKPDGDIVSVFSSPDAKMKDIGSRAHSMVELAKQNGGTKLDAFDTFLPELYSKHGFKETGRLAWDPEIAKNDLPNWDKNFFKEWNNGEPDVVFMQYEQPLPTLEALYDGLTPFQTEQLTKAIQQGLSKTNTKAGSLESVNEIKKALNGIINDSQKPNPTNRITSIDTADTQQLRPLKKRVDAILGRETKSVDARYAKVKRLEELEQIGYKFKPSETKFESLNLRTPLEKRAFLQGRLKSILDNVKDDKNLSKAIIADENTLKKVMPKENFEKLINDAHRIDTEYGRLSELSKTAQQRLRKDVMAEKPAEISIKRALSSLYNNANNALFRNRNRQMAQYLLNGNAQMPRWAANLERIAGRYNPDDITPYLAQYLANQQ